MNKTKALRLAGFLGTAGLTAALLAAGVAGTSAYFTDSEAGVITGTMGTIAIDGFGGYGDNGTDITFNAMLPGEAQTATVGYTNTGLNPQDVWVVFPQSALGDGDTATPNDGINDFGRYAEVHMTAFGTPVFDSANLNDDAESCPPGPSTDCNPLPRQILLASNLAPGASGDMAFSFKPSERFKNVQGLPILNLPYTLVATQHGIAPDNALN